jgi:murein DD-endopeptidase MepM/ murein hydrolase activator NlpD
VGSSRVVSVAATAAIALGGMTALPLLAVAGPGAAPCPAAAISADGSPTILGPATVTARQLGDWWTSTGRGQPSRLTVEVADLIRLYLSEGELEGVRGDLAFAQAVLETGYFTNSDTSRNNFAGIAHYDDAASGRPFASAAEGVRAQIQLLHKFAAGNQVELARPDVSPNAGASATTWAELAGTWATDPGYWTSLSGLFARMTAGAPPVGDEPAVEAAPACPPSGGMVVDGYSLPVDRRWYDDHPVWFTKPHHDYPAADIPVPSGTPIYAVVAGTVVSTPDAGRCGTGVVLNGDDGAQYSFCHGTVGQRSVAVGDRVEAGQLLMLSGNTGNSTGPHLHFGIRVGGQQRCPQNLLVAIAEGRSPSVADLPASGCSY